MRAKRINGTLIERFNAKYIITEKGCWEWQASRNIKGYGQIGTYNKRHIGANRASYLLFIGELNSEKELVCHRCDNPPCCNPFHLFKGSHSDNHTDAQLKGKMLVTKCPSLRAYIKGCRCVECVTVNSDYAKMMYNKNRDSVNEKRRKRWAERVINGEVKFINGKRTFIKK